MAPGETVSWSSRKQRQVVLGRRWPTSTWATGDPIVFLHGNPTSSYLWRNVIPHLERPRPLRRPGPHRHGRLRQAGRPGPGTLHVRRARRYLDAFLGARSSVAERVTFVVHDWGSALGFDWANRHPTRSRHRLHGGDRPTVARGTTGPSGARGSSRRCAVPAGEEMVLDENVFVEKVLPASVLRGLTDEAMAGTGARSASRARTAGPR